MFSIRKFVPTTLAVVFSLGILSVPGNGQSFAVTGRNIIADFNNASLPQHNVQFHSITEIVDGGMESVFVAPVDDHNYEVSDVWTPPAEEKSLDLVCAGENSSKFNRISLIVGSYSRRSISMNAVVTCKESVDRVGLRNLNLQRFQNGRWTTVRGWSNNYDYDTHRFSFAYTAYNLVSNGLYRVSATFTLRNGMTTETITRTTGSFYCR